MPSSLSYYDHQPAEDSYLQGVFPYQYISECSGEEGFLLGEWVAEQIVYNILIPTFTPPWAFGLLSP